MQPGKGVTGGTKGYHGKEKKRRLKARKGGEMTTMDPGAAKPVRKSKKH